MAKDFYHELVKRALVKDGWRITHDPFTIQFEDLRVFADLGAERVFAAVRGDDKIVVEIKVFGGVSTVGDFEKALGQYQLYRTLIEKLGFPHRIFLAVAEEIFYDFFQRPSIRVIVEAQRMQMLVFNPEKEEIVKWTTWSDTAK